MADHIRIPQPLACLGLDLTNPPTASAPFRFPFLKNVRPYRRSAIEPRPGLASVATSASNAPLHSARRLNDDTVPGSLRIIGASTKLFSESGGTLTQRDTGYSGDPLSMLHFRPTETPRPWMYIADRSRMRKINQSASLHQIGLPPPSIPPSSALAQRSFKTIDDFGYASDVALQAEWIEGGDAGNPTRLQWRVATNIAAILFDRGTSGWCCISPDDMAGIAPGLMLEVAGSENAVVHSIAPETTATTIDAILYESGSSGLCSIVLADPLPDIRRDSMLLLSSLAANEEYVRVLSTTTGPDGTTSLRCSTVNAQAAGDTVQAVGSFRIYLQDVDFSGGSVALSDDFDRANNESMGSNWVEIEDGTGATIQDNKWRMRGFGTSTSGRCLCHYNATVPNDQFSQAVYKGIGTGQFAIGGLAVRIDTSSTTSSATFYGLLIDDGATPNLHIVKWMAADLDGDPGNFTILASSAAISVDDVIRLEAIGTTIRAFVNGAQVMSVTDSDIASGGVGGFIPRSGDTNTYITFLDDWFGGGTGGVGATLRSDALCSSLTHSTGKATLTRTAAFDLSLIDTVGEQRPARGSDIIHLSIRLSDINLLTEGRLMFDIDQSTNDFTQNVLMHIFRPDDLTPAIAGDETFVDNAEDVVRNELIEPIRPIDRIDDPLIDDAIGGGDRPDNRLVELDGGIEDGVNPLFPDGIPLGSDESGTGDDQWLELEVRVSQLLRVGEDRSRTLKHVAAVRVELTFTASATAYLNSLYLAGGQGPDIGRAGTPYTYRYRYRCRETGVRSNHSPACRECADPHRQRVWAGLSGSSVAEVDRIDVSRFGGGLLGWRFLGSVRNYAALSVTGATNATPIVVTSTAHGLSNGEHVFIDGVAGNTAANGYWTVANKAADTFELSGSVGNGAYTSGGTVSPAFQDDFPDERIASAPALINDAFQPWPVVGSPANGAVTAVAGTLLSASGFSTSWAQGTAILVGQEAHVIYRVHSSSLIELAGNAGSSAAEWEVPAPVLLAQPLPILWGSDTVFAVGDPKNPGRLYYSNGNDPDATTEINWLAVTSPSEPLMSGFEYNARHYAFSSERLFAVYPNPGGIQRFVATEIPNSKGLFSRWGLAVGPKVWFVARDGIWETEGGSPRNISDEFLYPLFPHEGQPGRDTNGVPAPDFTDPDSMRLAYYDGWLYYTYADADGNYRTLSYLVERESWFYDEHFGDLGAIFYYGEEGKGIRALLAGRDHATDAVLVQATGTSDEGDGIACQVRTPSLDGSDPRSRKRWGDVLVDAEAQDAITAAAFVDDHTLAAGVAQITAMARSRKVIELAKGKGYLAYNISVLFSWSTHANTVTPSRLHAWEPSYLARPEDTGLRYTDWMDGGYEGHKEWRGAVIEADTQGISRTIRVYGADGVLKATLTVSHDGHQRLPYGFTPFLEHLVQIRPDDAAEWRLFKVSWIVDRKGEDAPIATAWQALYDDLSPAWVQGVYLRARTTGNVSVQVQRDDPDAGPVTEYTLTVNHNGESVRFYPFRENSHLSGGVALTDGDKGPFTASLVRLLPATAWELIGDPQWKFRPRPAHSQIAQDWTDDGYAGSKLLQGVRILADTRGVSRNLLIQRDGGTSVETLTINHAGVQRKPYSFASPVLCENFRPVPDVGADMKLWIEDIQWVWVPAPDLVTVWETIDTTHGLHGFQHLRDGYLAIISSATVTLLLTFEDATTASYAFSSTSGAYKKLYVPFGPKKFKAVKYKVSSASGFRLFREDCELRVKQWGDPGPYRIVRPFGGPSELKAEI